MLKLLLLFFALSANLPLFADEAAPPLPALPEPQHILVDNRILAKINGKTISVIDVMKKMDVFLSRAYPQYANSKIARFQFYTAQWRNTLSQLIDNELILADAAGIELEISDGEVRETMQERFGPNVMANLEQIGITYEEAREMIHSELMVHRMLWYRAQSKAYLSVGPKQIKDAYKEFCKNNPPENEWKYQVLSLRGKDETLMTALLDRTGQLLKNHQANLQDIYDALKSEEEETSSVTISLTPLQNVNDKTLATSHREALATLKPGEISAPISQASRDGSTVFRLFDLKERTENETPPFEKMFDRIHGELIDKAVSKESEIYLAKLRQKFSFDENYFLSSLPPDFQPFSLK